MKKGVAVAAVSLLAPFIALAQGLGSFERLLRSILTLVNNVLIPLLMAAAVVYFFIGLIKYIRSSGEGHKEGINTMIAGIVAIFIMVALWGIISFVGQSLGIGIGGALPAPGVIPTSQVQY